ncbi:elongator complex protein 5 [Humulus lupulus]|uniref:elongator complex protein 5 n=1 Tax=Humulus lupulus TaxID=3486 RepID=UPI002B40C38C|nr:elongator complex protein 5 [Humulus lupulus]XP_062107380.1 elongator complex protein 5 [Humulus lupulus]
MADSIGRALRDGALEGEHAPALTIKDSIASPFGFDVFSHVLSQLSSNILAGKSQSRGLVLVAFSRSPSFYVNFLKRRGVDVASSPKWIEILDCYTDPLGWKCGLVESADATSLSYEASNTATICRNVKDVNELLSRTIKLGQGLVGQGGFRFSAAIDSVSELLRHASMSSVSGLLSNLRSHDQVSSIFWLLHSDLHEDRVIGAFEYMSSMVASVEPLNQYAGGQRGTTNSISFLEQISSKGKFNVRFKRRNGRVRVAYEELHVEQSGVNFMSISPEDGVVNQGLIPKVQFNLQLTEKEQIDRANVVLPFEHQGNGKPIHIYDGRRSLADMNFKETSVSTKKAEINECSKGEIIYYRDSEDEMPDSDEDPDDDLDI